MFAVFAGIHLSLLTVFLGHGTALISVATTELFAGLQKMDRAQEEASLDLGATPWQTFWRVTLPNLKLSLIAAGLLIFTLSMDEIAVTFFLIGRDNTLPLEIWGRLRRGITPEINAISTLIFAVSIILSSSGTISAPAPSALKWHSHFWLCAVEPHHSCRPEGNNPAIAKESFMFTRRRAILITRPFALVRHRGASHIPRLFSHPPTPPSLSSTRNSPTAPARHSAKAPCASATIASPASADFPPLPANKSSTPMAWCSLPASSTFTITPSKDSTPIPFAETQIAQGITTAVQGPDGDSPWPITTGSSNASKNPAALNVAVFAGHATIREQVMGKDFKRVATPQEIEKMAALTWRAMNEGAIGLSSGLEYEVGSYSNTAELVAMAHSAAEHGGFYMHAHPR